MGRHQQSGPGVRVSACSVIHPLLPFLVPVRPPPPLPNFPLLAHALLCHPQTCVPCMHPVSVTNTLPRYTWAIRSALDNLKLPTAQLYFDDDSLPRDTVPDAIKAFITPFEPVAVKYVKLGLVGVVAGWGRGVRCRYGLHAAAALWCRVTPVLPMRGTLPDSRASLRSST